MSVPAWVQNAIFYQIFPDRFANGDPTNDPVNLIPWGSSPTSHGFQGGDLEGIRKNFDYLLDLGINAIYLNPIFLAPSTHRYDTTDYLRIDPRLGNLQDFRLLLDTAHRNSVRIILDGVFNHCGRGFFAFSDILENQEQSPYRDWFYIKKFPVNAYGRGNATDYLGWWNHKSLPKFNTTNPEVRRYLFNVVKYWMEQGIDGWRLDVPNEIDDDTFWAGFRDLVKGTNPEAYLLGEIWDTQPRWVGDHHFDGLMNYPFRSAVIDLLNNRKNVKNFSGTIDHLISAYPKENIYAGYELLGSHDTERIFSLLGNQIDKMMLAVFLQFTFPGSPAIYYGDEIGMQGGKDPDCRRAFPWDESHWNHELRDWTKKMISLRTQYPILCEGDFTHLNAEPGEQVFAFARTKGMEKMIGIVNPFSKECDCQISLENFNLPDGLVLHDLIGTGDELFEQGKIKLRLPGFAAKLLI